MNSLLTAVSDLFPRRKSGPKIVAILAAEEDRSLVSELCAASDWDVSFAGTRQEAHAALDRAKAQILLLDRNVAGDDWREAMSSFAASSDRACIMLVSRIVDTYLWNDVVRNGGYEVLAKPLQADHVSRAIKLAWSYWNTVP